MGEASLTILLTVISGVLVYILSEIMKEIWLSPLQKYKALKHDISYKLAYYARYYSNVIDMAHGDDALVEKYRAAGDDLRCLACELRGFIETLSWFKPMIPSRVDLYDAARELMGLSNGLFCGYETNTVVQHSEHNFNRTTKIKVKLKLSDSKE